MEFMDKGSLDGIYKTIGPIDIDVVGSVALAVLEGLTYLYDVHRIIHRGACCSARSLVTLASTF
jgi:mitogen-activated protein kinase kinase